MTPSTGRIVHYQLSAEDALKVMRRRTTSDSIRTRLHDAGEPRWPEGAQAHIGNAVTGGDRFPMLIVKGSGAENGPVNGQVFLDGTDVLWVTSVWEGAGPGTWAWPERT